MSNKISIVWFRQDLRLADNPAFYKALKEGLVMPVFILDTTQTSPPKEASDWWLYHSLQKLNQSLDNQLNVYKGDPKDIISSIALKHNIHKIFWNKSYEPYQLKLDQEIIAILNKIKVAHESFCGTMLWEPSEILKSDHTPYKVFTAFYKNGCLRMSAPGYPLPIVITNGRLKLDLSNNLNIEQLGLLPHNKWYNKLTPHWQVGEEAAHKKLEEFINNRVAEYHIDRNFPARDGSSKLSPHLHFGEISTNTLWHKIQDVTLNNPKNEGISSFLREIAWREFSYYLLYHFPNLPNENLQTKFNKIPWQNDKFFLKAWQKGQTGYPIIDAGMRELWQTGYMHNRVRMIVGSFLVKNLLIDWRYGWKWFWNCLVDADLANNSVNWQWVAGCGVDAMPYFRCFNPILQGEKFDSGGIYTRKFLPELKKLPDKFLFKPWQAPKNILEYAGVKLGENYPLPIVDFAFSRQVALQAFKSSSNGNQ